MKVVQKCMSFLYYFHAARSSHMKNRNYKNMYCFTWPLNKGLIVASENFKCNLYLLTCFALKDVSIFKSHAYPFTCALYVNHNAAFVLLNSTGDMSILEDALSKADCWK